MTVYVLVGTGFDHSHVIAIYAREADAEAHRARLEAASERARETSAAYFDSAEDEESTDYGNGPLYRAWRAAIAAVEAEGAWNDDGGVAVSAMEVRR